MDPPQPAPSVPDPAWCRHVLRLARYRGTLPFLVSQLLLAFGPATWTLATICVSLLLEGYYLSPSHQAPLLLAFALLLLSTLSVTCAAATKLFLHQHLLQRGVVLLLRRTSAPQKRTFWLLATLSILTLEAGIILIAGSWSAVVTSTFQAIVLVKGIANSSLYLHRFVPSLNELLEESAEVAQHVVATATIIHEEALIHLLQNVTLPPAREEGISRMDLFAQIIHSLPPERRSTCPDGGDETTSALSTHHSVQEAEETEKRPILRSALTGGRRGKTRCCSCMWMLDLLGMRMWSVGTRLLWQVQDPQKMSLRRAMCCGSCRSPHVLHMKVLIFLLLLYAVILVMLPFLAATGIFLSPACSSVHDCRRCAGALANCAWCQSLGRCIALTTREGTKDVPSEKCPMPDDYLITTDASMCDNPLCSAPSARSSCTACTSLSQCGWCKQSHTCMSASYGNITSSNHDCSPSQFVWFSSAC